MTCSFYSGTPKSNNFNILRCQLLKTLGLILGRDCLFRIGYIVAGFDYSADDLFGNITSEILGEWGMGIHIPWRERIGLA